MADLKFTGERIVPEADNCEPTFAGKMYQEHVARYLFASQLVSGRSVLDVGCGVGYGARVLAKSGAARVRAFDLSADAIAHARQHYAHPAITFEVDSAEGFDFGEKFDVVTCFELIEHVNDYLAVFQSIAAALKPDGFLVMSTPRALESKRTDFHTKEFSLVEFRQLFRRYFKRHHFYFENNHFASLIADQRPVSIEVIESLNEQYYLDQSDYFIVVATRSTKLPVDHLKPVIALNDDRYVLNLERDVAILHRAEDNLKQQLIDRETELATARAEYASVLRDRDALRESVDNLQAEVQRFQESDRDTKAELANVAQRLQVTVQQLASAKQATAEFQAQLAQAAVNTDALRTELKARSDELASARDLAARRDSALEGFREELRIGLSEGTASQARLRSAETLAGELEARLAVREEAIQALRGELFKAEERAGRLSEHANLLGAQLQDAGSRLSEQSRLHEQSLSLMARQAEALLVKLAQTESSSASRNEELREQLLDATSRIERLHVELAEVRGALEAQTAEYRLSLKTAYDEANRLGCVVEDLERSRAMAVREAEDNARQLAVLTAELTALRISTQQEVIDLRHELDGERSERSKVEADLAMSRASASAIEVEKSTLSADIESLQVQLDRADAEAAYLTRLVKMMRDSRSWKVTSPLRRAVDLALTARLYGLRARQYWEANGTWAFVQALGRMVRRRWTGEHFKVEMPAALPTSMSSTTMAPTPEFAVSTLVSSAPEQLDLASQVLDGVEMFIGCWEGESKRYRVHNVAAALQAEGCRVEVKPFSELPLLVTEGRTPKVVVVFRSPYDSAFAVEPFFDYARRLGIKVVFDIDDLVFDPAIVHLVDAFHGLSESDKALYIDGVHKYRRMLLESDVVTVTTDYLVDEVRKLGKPVSIVRNSINAEQLQIADQVIRGKVSREPGQPIVIGYFSGSKTHQKDFAQAEAALLRVMREVGRTRLLIVGYLDLGDAWREFDDRIDRQGFLPYLEMLEVLARCDVNLAPLEVGNPFCESKSELKYFEAAIVQVPTVASATGPFKLAIESGVTGFIAEGEEEWYRALMALVSDGELRDRIGLAARVSAIERFGPRTAARQALDTYGISTSSRSSRTPWERLRIDWVVPPIIIGGGGHRNIFRAAHHLQEFGHDVHLHIANMDESDEQLARIIRENFYPFKGHVRRYDCSFERTDVVFATHWSTVDAALRAKNLAREIMYFVQDFEPAFAPMGSEYVLAENTYRLGLYHVTSGPWCERLLRSQFGAVADHFRFPIDKDIYFPRPRTVAHKRLVFFAKPEMPRRCFELGILALRQVNSMRPEVEIVMFGSPHAAKQNLDFPVTFLKVVPTLEGLAEMYSNADAGMVFSTTNPSLVPYEMMACGLPVIDLDRPGNEVNYGDRRDIALLANPLPDVMATQVIELLDSDEQRSMRSRNGLEFAASFPTEEEMARRIESLIINRLRSKWLSPIPLADRVAS